MDSFEWNKIIGAVLGTAIFIFVVRLVAEKIYEAERPEKPGYVVEGVVETAAGGGAAAPVEETMPDWGTVMPTADVAAGKAQVTKCEQCHDVTKGGPNKIGPNLFGVVDRPRASHEGFAYSSAMKAKPGNWTYDELFKFIKAPGTDIPGTKMSFAGLRSEKDRINLIAYLRSEADTPAAIPAPAPKKEAAAPAEAAPAAGAPPKGPGGPAPRHAQVGRQDNCDKQIVTGLSRKPNVLFLLPPGWDALSKSLFGHGGFNSFLHGKDHYAPQQIDYFVGFRPPHGFLKALPRLKAIFSLGAGVDGFLRDPEFPRHLPVVRFVDQALQREMAQYVTLHCLIIHRHQREFDAAQQRHVWRQRMLARPSRELHIGILGMGDIGAVTAERLLMFDFQVSGWSRSRKNVPGVTSFAGPQELSRFLGQCDILVCMLPLTPETENILDAGLFAKLPKGAWVMNVGRGGHCNESDLVAALDSGHLAGAVLDVFQTEPLPADHVLWSHPKVTVTPHIAGITDPRNAAAFVVDCVSRAESGMPFPNLVDLSRGY